ncbi:hypothetical protein G7046_g6345 [Stylonectria norvegica]|nr:hypothetical protein G7046_g6345 [Stylonectria norvegica]
MILFIFLLNTLAVGVFGEAEFCFASIKLITILGLLILSVVLILGGGPTHDRLGFRYWRDPGVMKQLAPASGATGRFLAFFRVLVYAAFTYAGVEMIAAASGEAQDPRRNIPRAVRRVIYRILFFYVLGALAISCLVSSNNPNLLGANSGDAPGAARSPWVIGITSSGIRILPNIINAAILTSALSSANAFLYTGSRYLYGLSQNGQAPRQLLYCTKSGVPIYCVLVTGSISLLTYMTVSVAGSTVFLWFANLTTVAGLITWIAICFAFIRFHKAQQVQGLTDQNIWFRSPFQPYLAWASLIFFAILLVFNGFPVFMSGKWNVSDFVVAYIGIPIFGSLAVFWKIVKKTKMPSLEEMDLVSGKGEIDAMESSWVKPQARNMFERDKRFGVSIFDSILEETMGPSYCILLYMHIEILVKNPLDASLINSDVEMKRNRHMDIRDAARALGSLFDVVAICSQARVRRISKCNILHVAALAEIVVSYSQTL